MSLAIGMPDGFWAFKEITAPTNVRTLSSLPCCRPFPDVGNKVPVLKLGGRLRQGREWLLLLANLQCATVFDFVTRQKVQGQHVESGSSSNSFPSFRQGAATGQCASGPRRRRRSSGRPCWNSPIQHTTWLRSPAILDHVDEEGARFCPPFRWDVEQTSPTCAPNWTRSTSISTASRIGTTSATSTPPSPSFNRDQQAAYGAYRSRDLCLAWTSALAAGQPDAEVEL